MMLLIIVGYLLAPKQSGPLPPIAESTPDPFVRPGVPGAVDARGHRDYRSGHHAPPRGSMSFRAAPAAILDIASAQFPLSIVHG